VVVLTDAMPGAAQQRIGNHDDVPWWYGPSADLTVHILGEATSEWVLCHNRARHAGEGYASLENTIWDPERGLVAYATQMMFFSFPQGEPPAHKLRVG
jgi:hypothetical protein